MATIIGIIDNVVKYNKDRYGEYHSDEYCTPQYNKYLETEKSVMTDEEALALYNKTREYLKNNSKYDLMYYDEIREQLECLLNARIGYRKKLIAEKADDVEYKVNQMYPLEELFQYNFFRD